MFDSIDHFMYASPRLDTLCEEFAELVGVIPSPGGEHPTIGTHNRLVGGDTSVYIELIGANPASDVRSDLRAGLEALSRPQLHRFIMRRTSADFPALSQAYREAGINAPVHDLQRTTPDKETLRWKLMIPEANPYGLFAPFFIDWLDTRHPSENLDADVSFLDCEAGHPRADVLLPLWKALGINIPLRRADSPYMRVVLGTPNGEVVLTG